MADHTPSYIGQLSPDGLWRWDGNAWRPADSGWIQSIAGWGGWKVRRSVGWLGLLSAVAIGLLVDQALRAGAVGLAASITFVVGAAVLVFVGALDRIQSRLLVVGAAIFGAWFTTRASLWLLWPDLAAALAFLGLAVSFGNRGSLFELGASELAARALVVSAQAMAGGAFILRPIVGVRARIAAHAPLLRGVLISLPIAALLATLLASADPVFASFFNLNVDPGQLLLDIALVVVGALCAAGLLRSASSEDISHFNTPGFRLGATEALVVVSVLDGLFAAFAVAQVIAATGAAADTLRSAGITYSEYARSGFFQLLWVSGITLGLLFIFGRITGFGDRTSRLAFVFLAEAAVALTLMIDVVAFRRLSVYEEAYGFTMLRLYSHVFGVWIAVIFVMLAADLAGLLSPRKWFIGATMVSGAILLFGLNVANPEAVVVRLNTSHAQATHKIDATYLSELSSDATPALLASRSSIDPGLRQQVDLIACRGSRSYSAPFASFNWAEAQAVAARRTYC